MIPSFVFTTLLTLLLLTGRSPAGSLDPTNAPGPTMHTLEEIYQKQVSTDQKVAAFVAPQTLSSSTTVVNAGYYAATTLTNVDPQLASGNIKVGVTIFGITGVLSTNTGGGTYSAGVPRTGQTASILVGDDGYYRKGVVLPNPRFTVQSNTNCVLDNLTGLMWARNANMWGGLSWTNALSVCETLNYGGYTDWRLPNRRELLSLIDDGRYNPALCNTAGTGNWANNDPFTNVQLTYYWSSTRDAASISTLLVWYVSLTEGYVGHDFPSYTYPVWPVRGGP
jgi:hypothetical protein